jgi:hypothetical protein
MEEALENMVQEKQKKSTAARTKVTVKATKVLKAAAAKPARATTARKAPAARKAATPTPPTLAHEEIARRAHELYVQSGFQPGRDEEFWLMAECELLAGS